MNKTIYGNAQDRINYACLIIAKNSTSNRSFDNCFEMGDAKLVAAGVYKRALKNQKIMANLHNYLNIELCKIDYQNIYQEEK